MRIDLLSQHAQLLVIRRRRELQRLFDQQCKSGVGPHFVQRECHGLIVGALLELKGHFRARTKLDVEHVFAAPRDGRDTGSLHDRL